MPTIRYTDAAVEPLTLAEAKRHLRVDDDDADTNADIASAITTARMDAEHRLQRSLITTVWQYTADGFPWRDWRDCRDWHDRAAIRLPMGQVNSIVHLKYTDVGGVLRTWAADQYQLHADRITPAPGVSWPDTLADKAGAVEVRYSAGYGDAAATVPGPIKSWLRLAVADLWEQRRRSTEKPLVPQHFADHLLDAYRIWSV